MMSNKRKKRTGSLKLAANRSVRIRRGAKKLAGKTLRAAAPTRRWF